MNNWSVVCVAPKSEFRFRDEALALGLSSEIYIPLSKYIFTVKKTKQKRLVTKPLFSRYIFVNFVAERDDIVQKLTAIHMEFRAMRMSGGKRVFVYDREIERLKLLESGGAFDNLPVPVSVAFQNGRIMIINEKHKLFSGLKCTIIDESIKDSSNSVLVDIEGGLKARIAVECLSAVVE